MYVVSPHSIPDCHWPKQARGRELERFGFDATLASPYVDLCQSTLRFRNNTTALTFRTGSLRIYFCIDRVFFVAFRLLRTNARSCSCGGRCKSHHIKSSWLRQQHTAACTTKMTTISSIMILLMTMTVCQ